MRAPFRFDISVSKKQRNPEERFTLLHTLGGTYQPVSTTSQPHPRTDERPPACKLCLCLSFVLLAVGLPVGVGVYVTRRPSERSASSERDALLAKHARAN